jgi:hypothetical protein
VIFLPMFVPDPDAYAGAFLPILAQVVLIGVLLRRRHETDLAEPAGTATAPSSA